VTLRELLEIRSLELIGLDDRHPARRDRLERRCAGTLLQVGPLPEEGARPVLGQALTVVHDPDDPVENEEDLGARLALLGEDAAGGEFLDRHLVAAHDPGREGAFQCRLHCGHQRLGVLVAPRGVPPERLPVPILEVGESRLVREGPRPVVDPVAGEPAGPRQRPLTRAVGVQRQGQRRPDERSLPLDVGPAPL